jgi:plastocyanin
MKKSIIFFAICISFIYTASATKYIITSTGTTFSPNLIQIYPGDTVLFNLASMHNAVEVSQATWEANGNTSNGGFMLPMGGGTLINLGIGMHYYVCVPHASLGMKGRIEVLNPVDIKEYTKPTGFSVFPNPFKNAIQISYLVSDTHKDNIEIYNLAGQTVYKISGKQEGEMNTLNLDLGFLPDGIYFVSATQNGERSIEKVIKQ